MLPIIWQLIDTDVRHQNVLVVSHMAILLDDLYNTFQPGQTEMTTYK